MADFILSPNMNLPVPIVGQDPGPDWANNINASLEIVDQHDHSSGSGVPITPNGININSDFPMNNNNLTLVKTVNFFPQLATLPGTSPNLGCIYVAGNELIYNDEAGNVVPITNNGSVNAGAGSITGLPSGTAGVSYSSVGKTYTFQSSTNTSANLDAGSVIIRKVVAASAGITISAPLALASDYTITLPAAPPSVPSFLSMDNTGNISVTTPVVPAANIAVSTGTGVSDSTTSATYVDIVNLSSTLTTVGRPVRIGLQPDGVNGPSYFNNSVGGSVTSVALLRDAVIVGEWLINVTTERSDLPSGAFNYIDPSPSAGSHTYTWQWKTNTGTITLFATKSVALEIYQ